MQILTQLCQQKGASTLETSLVVLPVMLVCLLGFELVQAQQALHLVNLALQEAGRVHKSSLTVRDFLPAWLWLIATLASRKTTDNEQGWRLAAVRRLRICRLA